jgi:hypothetical protein
VEALEILKKRYRGVQMIEWNGYRKIMKLW